MAKRHRVSGDDPYTTWAEQLREGDKQMNGEDEEFAHEANGTTTIIACKTARHRRIPSLEKAAAACFGLIPKERTGAHLPIY